MTTHCVFVKQWIYTFIPMPIILAIAAILFAAYQIRKQLIARTSFSVCQFSSFFDVICHPRCWSLSVLLVASLCFWTEAWKNALTQTNFFRMFYLLSGRERKLQNLDEKAMQEIMRSIITEEEENDVNAGNKSNGKKKQVDAQKAKSKVQQRLAQEKKSKKQDKEDDDEDMSDEDLVKFAKGSRATTASKGKSKKQ